MVLFFFNLTATSNIIQDVSIRYVLHQLAQKNLIKYLCSDALCQISIYILTAMFTLLS